MFIYDLNKGKQRQKPKRQILTFNSVGESGNIHWIIGKARNILQMQRRIGDFNVMRDRVFNSHSYDAALQIINEYVKLIDLSGARKW